MDQAQPRQAYSAAFAELENDVLDMVSRAEQMVVSAVDALVALDHTLAYATMQMDDEIDQKDIEIEQQCLRLLALQQPMGSDLREIGTILKIITDIERIGDLSVDLAKTTLKITAEYGRSDYVDLKRMSTIALQMLRESVQMFVRRDVSGLERVAALEDEVDGLYRELRSQVHEYMKANGDHVVAASWMLLAVHNIERIADHALNIAERVSFMVTGRLTQISDDMLTGTETVDKPADLEPGIAPGSDD